MKRWFLVIIGLCVCLLAPTTTFARNPSEYPVDIIIDVGHGGIDSGTSYGDILEKDINMAVGKILYDVLTNEGYRVVLNRDGDYALSDENHWLNSSSRHLRDLAQRRQLVAELNPQLLISLHVNWSNRKSAHGPVVLYQQNNQSFLVADVMQRSLNDLFATKTRPQVGKTYYLLRHSMCPSVIVEMGFLSNASDRNRLVTPHEQAKIAQAIQASVREYFILAGHIQKVTPKESWIQIFKRLFLKSS